MSARELLECVGGPCDGLRVVPGRAVILLGVPVGEGVVVHAYELRGDGKYHHALVVGVQGGGR